MKERRPRGSGRGSGTAAQRGEPPCACARELLEHDGQRGTAVYPTRPHHPGHRRTPGHLPGPATGLGTDGQGARVGLDGQHAADLGDHRTGPPRYHRRPQRFPAGLHHGGPFAVGAAEPADGLDGGAAQPQPVGGLPTRGTTRGDHHRATRHARGAAQRQRHHHRGRGGRPPGEADLRLHLRGAGARRRPGCRRGDLLGVPGDHRRAAGHPSVPQWCSCPEHHR